MPGRTMLSGPIPTFESSQVADGCDPAARLVGQSDFEGEGM